MPSHIADTIPKQADLNSPESLAPALEGAHACFLVTNFWEIFSAEKEIQQGKNVADAAKKAGVKHLIASTLLNVTEASKGRLPNISHFDGKAKIEEYIRESGVPATFIWPGMFMTAYYDSLRKNQDGVYQLALPVSDEKARLPLFDPAGDTGMVVCSTELKYGRILTFFR